MTEQGIKRAAGIDYTSKFKDINWTTEIERELPIRMVNDKERRQAVVNPADRLPGSETPITVSQAFMGKVQHMGKFECMRKLIFTPEKGTPASLSTPTIISISWQMFYERAFQFAKALHALGVPERARVCFLGPNSPEHFMALMGTILANCIFTEIYITNGPQACATQIQHSQSQVIVCDTRKRYEERFLPIKD